MTTQEATIVNIGDARLVKNHNAVSERLSEILGHPARLVRSIRELDELDAELHLAILNRRLDALV